MALRNLGTNWSPPSESTLAPAVSRSAALLSKAWNNPKQLGIGSEIERECNAHFEEIISWDIPSASDEKAVFEKALWLAWYATWRARDYTLQGFRNRIEEKETSHHALWRAIHNLENVAISHLGERWPPGHVPQFDREGNPDPIPNGGQRAFQSYAQLPHFEDGWMLQNDQSTNLVFQSFTATNWSYFGPGSNITNNSLIGCWVANSNFQSETNISRTVFQGAIQQSAALVARVKWSDAVFLQDCMFKVTEGGIEHLLENARFGGALTLKAERHEVPQLILNSTKGIRNLIIDVNSTNIRRIAVSNCDLKLTVKSLRASPATDSLTIDNSNIHLVCSSAAAGSISVENCALSGEFSGGDIDRLVVRNSDIETAIQADIPSESLKFSAIVIRELLLEDCQILHEAYQSGASFRSISIKGCEFFSALHLRDTKIMSAIRIAELKGKQSVFHKLLDLSCTSPNLPGQDIPYTEFSGCHFNDSVNFNNREFSGTTSFANSQFDHYLLVHGASLHQDTSFTKTKFGWDKIVRSNGTPESIRIQLNSLSNSYRSLRQAMDRNNASHDVQAFHLLQMRTRNHWKFGSSSFAERIIGNAYDAISEYGTSILRPLAWLVASFVVTAALYSFLVPLSGNFGEIVTAAFTSTFRPFITFSATYDTLHAWQFSFDSGHEVLAYLTQNYGLIFSLVSFVQSVFVVLLIFLMLLAIRRKYQLN